MGPGGGPHAMQSAGTPQQCLGVVGTMRAMLVLGSPPLFCVPAAQCGAEWCRWGELCAEPLPGAVQVSSGHGAAPWCREGG